jgi:uncharacterized membrane protein YvbJ
MFCNKCGHKIEMGDKFCTGCGIPLGDGMGAKKGPSFRWPKIIGIVGAVVLIVVIVALSIGRGVPHSSPEVVVRSVLEACCDRGDAQQILDLTDPQLLAETMREYDVEIDEIRQAIQNYLDTAQEEIEMGTSFSFEIDETTRLDGEALTEVTITTSYAEGGTKNILYSSPL